MGMGMHISVSNEFKSHSFEGRAISEKDYAFFTQVVKIARENLAEFKIR
jgi:hypothetical protein